MTSWKKTCKNGVYFLIIGSLALVGLNHNSNGGVEQDTESDDTTEKNKRDGIIPYAHADTSGGGGDGDGDGCCFPPTARITTPSGSKNISELSIGEEVVAYDETTGTFTTATIKNVLKHGEGGTDGHNFSTAPLLKFTYEAGDTEKEILLTSNHPTLDEQSGDFKKASTFAVGDTLLTQSESVVISEIAQVDESKYTDAQHVVYNLTLTNGPHTYVADGVVVHNKGGGDAGADCL